MDIKKQLEALDWFYSLAKGSETNKVYIPQKPRIEAPSAGGSFEELIPEQTGANSAGLLKMFAEISSEKGISPHLAAVLRNGKLIAKAAWSPYKINTPHISHSMSKSIVSMAVGIAVQNNLLDISEKITDIFYDELPDKINENMRKITVENLLTMSSGASFNEAKALMSSDWVKNFLSSDMMFEPGEKFHYNSLNTYMLSAIICKRSGISLSEFLENNLFSYLGINNFYWEKCPRGIEKGGWGLYLNIFGYAKLGQLYLNGGVWRGKQIIDPEWIANSTSKKIDVPDKVDRNGYGYQIWILKNGLGYLFSGMFGQNIYIFPERNMVIAINSGSSGIFPAGRLLDIVTGYISESSNFSDVPIKNFRYSHAAKLRNSLAEAKFGNSLPEGEKPSFAERLRRSIFSAGKEKTADEIPQAAAILAGNQIIFENNRAGIMPVLIQVMNGNFESGIDSAAFFIRNGTMIMRLLCGEETHDIPLSFSGIPAYCEFEKRGDIFRTGNFASLTLDEDDIPVLKVTICFIETSCTKILKFIFGNGGIILKVREDPELYSAIDDSAPTFLPSLGNTVRKAIEAVMETDIAEYKIKHFLEPDIKGTVTNIQ